MTIEFIIDCSLYTNNNNNFIAHVEDALQKEFNTEDVLIMEWDFACTQKGVRK